EKGRPTYCFDYLGGYHRHSLPGPRAVRRSVFNTGQYRDRGVVLSVWRTIIHARSAQWPKALEATSDHLDVYFRALSHRPASAATTDVIYYRCDVPRYFIPLPGSLNRAVFGRIYLHRSRQC